MIDCPTCHRAIDGLACRYCRPPRPPIPTEAKARIDAILAKTRRHFDPEAAAERAAIQDEAAP